MKNALIVLAIFVILTVIAFFAGCFLGHPIPTKGNLAGQVVDSSGTGVGDLFVSLIDEEAGKELRRQETEKNGNYFFRELKAGTYTLKLYDDSGTEIHIEPVEIELGKGRTKTAVITILPDEE